MGQGMNSLIMIGQGAGALLAILSLVGLFVKWALIKPIKAYIDVATAPIHPNANGGLSLADANKTLIRIENTLQGHLADHDTPK